MFLTSIFNDLTHVTVQGIQDYPKSGKLGGKCCQGKEEEFQNWPRKSKSL